MYEPQTSSVWLLSCFCPFWKPVQVTYFWPCWFAFPLPVLWCRVETRRVFSGVRPKRTCLPPSRPRWCVEPWSTTMTPFSPSLCWKPERKSFFRIVTGVLVHTLRYLLYFYYSSLCCFIIKHLNNKITHWSFIRKWNVFATQLAELCELFCSAPLTSTQAKHVIS